MELIFMLVVIAILLACICIIYLLKDIQDKMYINKQVDTKKKQFTREHTSTSKTNFRKHIEWANRCVRKIQKS